MSVPTGDTPAIYANCVAAACVIAPQYGVRRRMSICVTNHMNRYAKDGHLAAGPQNRLAAILMSMASTVVLNRYARMQCSEPIRRMGLETKGTSAVCPEVPMMAEK